jgi:hypothetical protein
MHVASHAPQYLSAQDTGATTACRFRFDTTPKKRPTGSPSNDGIRIPRQSSQ